MVVKSGPTNLGLKKLIADLRSLSTKEKVGLWKRLANELSKSTRSRREVNLYTINETIRDGEIAVVPGKVLANGEFTKKVTVAAFRFSAKAKESINNVGKTITIQQLMKDNPKGKKVRILG